MKKISIILIFTFLLSNFGPSYGKGASPNRADIGSSNPSYYSFEDLRDGLKKEEFWFANNNKPDDALVDLGYDIKYAGAGLKRQKIASKVSSNPGKYRVKKYKSLSNWNDSRIIDFDWNRFNNEKGRRGDLIFLRANNVTSDLVKIFSNWTHMAIVDDPRYKYVFEAMKDGGVDKNYAPSKWQDTTYFSSKRLKNLSNWQAAKALDDGIRNYRYKPYIPRFSYNDGMVSYIEKWGNPNDTSSMYCSKLVYLTFKPFVDLDTQNTSVDNYRLQDRAPGAYLFSWIGVSPDDIYYSTALSKDFCYSDNVRWI